MTVRATSAPGGRPRAGRPPRAAAVLAAALVLGGCVNQAREVAIGNQIASQVNAQLPLVTDVPLNLYVTDLGRMIAHHSARPDLQYYFYIVDSPSLNAFALPGGHIYVNRGLIERTRDVSELAGVLAHEIGHVAARHGAQTLEREMRTHSMARVMYQLILDREPMLKADALEVGSALWNARNSRAAEQEADHLAVEYLVQSGVDPRGMLSLFSALWEEEQRVPASTTVSWFSTHPGTAQRMQATREQIRLLPPPRQALARNNESYAAFLRRLSRQPPSLDAILMPANPPAARR